MKAIVIISKTLSERGQTMAEYAVVLGVITIAIVLTIGVLSDGIEIAFQRTVDLVKLATG